MARRLSIIQGFKASKGWYERFYRRNSLGYYPNIEILTHYDFRQRFCKSNEELASKFEAYQARNPYSLKQEAWLYNISSLYAKNYNGQYYKQSQKAKIKLSL